MEKAHQSHWRCGHHRHITFPRFALRLSACPLPPHPILNARHTHIHTERTNRAADGTKEAQQGRRKEKGTTHSTAVALTPASSFPSPPSSPSKAPTPLAAADSPHLQSPEIVSAPRERQGAPVPVCPFSPTLVAPTSIPPLLRRGRLPTRIFYCLALLY